MILAIDPGSRETGVALFDDGELVLAFLAQQPKKQDKKGSPHYVSLAEVVCKEIECAGHNLDIIEELVGERPEVYRASSKPIDDNDLITIAMMLGALTGMLSAWLDTVRYYLPKEWKKQAPKHVVEKRIRQILSKEELSRIQLPSAPSLHHNVWDAIGIGLKRLGRYKP